MKIATKRSRLLVFMLITIVAISITIIISYISLFKLVFIDNNIMMKGEKMTLLAKRTRVDLLKNHNAKPVLFTTKDGKSLSGIFIKRNNPKGSVILCHGYQGCKELMAYYIPLLPDHNLLLFDFRGHGENKKSFVSLGCHEYKDIIAASDWLKAYHPETNKMLLTILGVSMGGAATLKAAELYPNLCDALIIDSSFSSLRSVIESAFGQKSGLPNFPFLYIVRKMFNYYGSCDIDSLKPFKSIKQIKKPLMLIHSCIDTLVPGEEALRMYAHAEKTHAKLWVGPECKHGWLHKEHPELYKKKIMKFLKKIRL